MSRPLNPEILEYGWGRPSRSKVDHFFGPYGESLCDEGGFFSRAVIQRAASFDAPRKGVECAECHKLAKADNLLLAPPDGTIPLGFWTSVEGPCSICGGATEAVPKTGHPLSHFWRLLSRGPDATDNTRAADRAAVAAALGKLDARDDRSTVDWIESVKAEITRKGRHWVVSAPLGSEEGGDRVTVSARALCVAMSTARGLFERAAARHYYGK